MQLQGLKNNTNITDEIDSDIYKLSIFDLLDSIGTATFVIDKNSTVVYWNQACEHLTGVSATTVLNTNQHWQGFYTSPRPCLADLALMDSIDKHAYLYPNIKKSEGTSHGLVSFNWCSTSLGPKYLVFEANALFDEKGNIIGAIETLRDVSALKNAELSLEKVALKHKKLFELSKIDFLNTSDAFEAYLKESAKQLEINKVSIWKYDEERTKLTSIYSLTDDVFDTKEISIDIKDHFNYVNRIETESYLAIDDVRNNPAVDEISDYLDEYNIISLLDVPIVIDGQVRFILCHESTGKVKHWSSEDKDFVRSVGDIIANKFISIENKTNEDKLKYYAAHDSLTGLLNRYSFEKQIHNLVNINNTATNIIFFMDLDEFKVVNDTCGHSAGDELIKNISELLLESTRNEDILARLGGDEFGLLIKNCSEENAKVIADKIVHSISEFEFRWNNKTFKIGISIGIASFTKDEFYLEEVMARADTACYMAKDKGKNRSHLYASTDREINEKRNQMQLISKIQKAIDENKFELYLQGIASLEDNTISHYEVLARMRDEENDLLPPGKFIPAAERYHLMNKIDRLIIENTFNFLKQFKNKKSEHNINVSINLSGNSVTDNNFLGFLTEIISENIDIADNVSFELTETAAVSNTIVANKFINTISGLGCKFALDDFGSGVSSYGYLKNLPFDILKIDGIFVKDITTDPISQAVVRSINEVSHILGMTTVAEYVENEEIEKLLKEMGVDYGQGYGIQKPFPAEELLV